MKIYHQFVLALAVASPLCAAEVNAVAAPASALYKDPTQPVEARVKDLLARMTLDEKVQQLSEGSSLPGFFSISQKARGTMTSNAERFREWQHKYRTETRLGIPVLNAREALHGVVLAGATIYPQAIALGATWNPALVKEMAGQIAEEASAVGICQVLAPVLDLGRDPRYGRIEETYGECPTLVSRMGVAYITGAQGDNAQNGLAPDKIYCMTKHFAGYSVPANGLNISPSLIGERELRTHHLLPFEAAVKEAHVMAVMPSYNSVDGMPSHANAWLLTDVLRHEWGFQGYVYSDWGGIDMLVKHRLAENNTEAGLLAIQAGVDEEAPGFQCYSNLPGLVASRQLDVSVIDQSVSRLLRGKFLAGLFDGKRPDGDPALVAKAVHTPEHIATSRKLAEESIILLKNENHLLPLDRSKLNSIAVIGPNADQVQFGGYSWTRSNQYGVSFLQALKTQFGERLKLNYAKGCDLTGLDTNGFGAAVAAAESSDVAVVVIGDTSRINSGVGWEDSTLPENGTVGEGFDVSNPVPPGIQEDLVKAIVATGKPTIVILLNGRPYCLPWMHDHAPAIVEAFFPGEQQGNAMVDILFGKVNPSGRLPVTLARSAGHIPCTYDYKSFGRGYYDSPGSPGKVGHDYVFDSPAPLWPFGFGLSYTTFEYSGLKMESTQVKTDGDMLRFSFAVKNTGRVAGKVVPQAYWRLLNGQIAPPEKRLLRFEKIELLPGETRSLSYAVPVAEFRQLTPDKKWVVDPAAIEIQVGDNAEATNLLKADFAVIERDQSVKLSSVNKPAP